MNAKRTVEIFSAGCGCCQDTIKLVKAIACPSCDIVVLDMQVPAVAQRARNLSIHSVPAVVIDGKLSGLQEEALRAAGVGIPL